MIKTIILSITVILLMIVTAVQGQDHARFVWGEHDQFGESSRVLITERHAVEAVGNYFQPITKPLLDTINAWFEGPISTSREIIDTVRFEQQSTVTHGLLKTTLDLRLLSYQTHNPFADLQLIHARITVALFGPISLSKRYSIDQSWGGISEDDSMLLSYTNRIAPNLKGYYTVSDSNTHEFGLAYALR